MEPDEKLPCEVCGTQCSTEDGAGFVGDLWICSDCSDWEVHFKR